MADAERVELVVAEGSLRVRFVDWQGLPRELVLPDTQAFRWQALDADGAPRDDMTYKAAGSAWLAAQQRPAESSLSTRLRHCKRCFNACGSLDVICRVVEVGPGLTGSDRNRCPPAGVESDLLNRPTRYCAPMQIQIDLTPHAAPEDAAALREGIVAFNHARVAGLEPIEAELRFFVFARNDQGAVVGGLRAACYWNTLHVELLWLSESLRGQGAGRALMARAEDFACENDCQVALVETTSWQARPFYEKCGYACIATIPDRPRGHVSFTLSKRLDAPRTADAQA